MSLIVLCSTGVTGEFIFLILRTIWLSLCQVRLESLKWSYSQHDKIFLPGGWHFLFPAYLEEEVSLKKKKFVYLNHLFIFLNTCTLKAQAIISFITKQLSSASVLPLKSHSLPTLCNPPTLLSPVTPVIYIEINNQGL